MLSSGGAARLLGPRRRKLHIGLGRMMVAAKGIYHLISAEAEEGDEEDEDPAYSHIPVGISTNHLVDFDLVAQLKACAKLQDLCRGRKLHNDILERRLFGKNLHVGNALIHMYVKCGAIASARDVFDELPLRDIISWTTLIAGYTQHGPAEEALELFERLQLECLAPDVMTLACALKACGIIEAAEKGREIHAELVNKGLLYADSMIGNALLDMYVKCHALEDTQDVFDKLPYRDVVSWTILIQGYCLNRHGVEALKCYEEMQHEGLSPNALTFAFALKACGNVKLAKRGTQIHAEIVKRGLVGQDNTLDVALVDMYAKSGAIAKAKQVFMELPVRDRSSWAALVAGYCQHGHSEEVLICFEEMHGESVALDAASLCCLLQACSSTGAIEKGERLHAQVLRENSLGAFGNALLDMYAKCGALVKAQLVFEELPDLDVVSWTALISGYAEHGHAEHALHYFERMQGQGFSVDAVTFSCVLKACASIAAAKKGIELHSEIARKGFLGKNIILGNALVDLYAKCGELAKAQEVFDELASRDLVSWNILIAAYAQNWKGEAAINCLEQMQQEGLVPDEATFSCIVKACSMLDAVEKGNGIHAEIARQGLLEKNNLLGNALVDMYSKCGALRKAQEVFDGLPVKGVVSWTSLIEGYCQSDCSEQALHCFEQMQCAGICPNAVTFLAALHACGNLGAVQKGEELHTKIVRHGLLEGNSALGAALVDMYAKCGALQKAQQVFDELAIRNVVSWTALMAGYSQIGKHDVVFQLLNKMAQEDVDPNSVTFIIVLNACSHLGMVDEGEMHFNNMKARYCIIPTSEHQTCMVNLFSCSGLFDKAMSMIQRMPSDCLPAWFTLLGACRKWGNVKLGRFAFEQVVRLDKEFDLAYVCMRNIYTIAGMQEEASKVEAMRMRSESWKE